MSFVKERGIHREYTYSFEASTIFACGFHLDAYVREICYNGNYMDAFYSRNNLLSTDLTPEMFEAVRDGK